MLPRLIMKCNVISIALDCIVKYKLTYSNFMLYSAWNHIYLSLYTVLGDRYEWPRFSTSWEYSRWQGQVRFHDWLVRCFRGNGNYFFSKHSVPVKWQCSRNFISTCFFLLIHLPRFVDSTQVCFITKLPPGVQGQDREVQLNLKHGAEAINYDKIAEVEKLKPLEVKLQQLEDLSENIVKGRHDWKQIRV